MEQIIYIAAIAVLMLIIGYFIGQSEVRKLKKENQNINKLYRKTALEMHNSEGRNRRLRNCIANYLPEKESRTIEKNPKPVKWNLGKLMTKIIIKNGSVESCLYNDYKSIAVTAGNMISAI
ncbi:MAG: hypothetical protein IPK06_04815 [Ignavibacteriae bacterium]|nr:hypothetical protein [Ignavibacteriota bacterium]